MDTACIISVTGDTWWEDYKSTLIKLGLGHLIIEVPENATYRFGDDGTLKSYIKVTACLPKH